MAWTKTKNRACMHRINVRMGKVWIPAALLDWAYIVIHQQPACITLYGWFPNVCSLCMQFHRVQRWDYKVHEEQSTAHANPPTPTPTQPSTRRDVSLQQADLAERAAPVARHTNGHAKAVELAGLQEASSGHGADRSLRDVEEQGIGCVTEDAGKSVSKGVGSDNGGASTQRCGPFTWTRLAKYFRYVKALHGGAMLGVCPSTPPSTCKPMSMQFERCLQLCT